MNFLMLSCKKASELIDKRLIVNLSFYEKIRLRMHTSMCDACNAYEKQSSLMDEALHHHISKSDKNKVPTLHNESLKKKIKSNLK